MKVGRLIHEVLESHQLPTEWEHPAEQIRHEGAQVLGAIEALTIAESDEHVTDDWYKSGSYSHLAIIDVDGMSGESGRSCRGAVVEGDISTMYVISLSDLEWELTEIWMEMLDEGYDLPETDMGLPPERWWSEHEEKVLSRLVDRMDDVDPEFVNTLD